MLIQRCHINFFDSSFRLTSEKKAKAPLYWSFEMVTGGFFSQRVINAENVSVSSAAEKAKSWVAQRTTHDWWLGGPSQFWVVRQWYTETMKSMKELVKMSQSVSALYSDTSPNRHTDGFVQDWGISSALAMEILQSCAKPWIRYQCICCLSTFLPKYFLQNINNSLVANRTIHGRTFSRPLDSWVAFGDRATVFQQHCVSWRHHATSHRWAPSLMIDSLHLCFHYHDYHNLIFYVYMSETVVFCHFIDIGMGGAVFNPRPLRPKGYCRHRMRLSVHLSVCLFPSFLLTQ